MAAPMIPMLTYDAFRRKWQSLHRPSMNVDGDAAFYYQVYCRLLRMAERGGGRFDEAALFSLLLYTENTASIGLDGVYEYMYRSLGDVVVRWCRRTGMKADVASQVRRLVSEAVAGAPRSSLIRWVTESVLSRDFLRLSDMLIWFAREDRAMRIIYPDLRYRKDMFLRLTCDECAARQMLWPDLAFNWRDKHGASLSDALAGQFRLSASSREEQERAPLRETADILGSIRSERLDTYTVIEKKDECTLTLRHRDGRVFHDVTFHSPLPEDCLQRCLAVQLVTCLGKTCVNGPALRFGSGAMTEWDGGRIWSVIMKKERAAARRTFFTTLSGRKISRYDDLYTFPEDTEEAYCNGLGIYTDEPNMLDFMEWLKPAENADRGESFVGRT